jgi:dTDP-4-amino-4,6-dideoxygalactose transaminase
MIPSLSPHLGISDLAAMFSIGRDAGKTFKEKLKEYFGFKYLLTFSSGRAGLYNILKAHKIQDKDILVSAYTCCVVTEAIVQSGNKPVFIDAHEKSFNAKITESNISKYISNLGAIIVTNLYGFTDFSDVDFIDKDRNFLVILDDALSPDHISQSSKMNYDYVTVSCGVRKPFSCLGGGIAFTQKEEKFRTLKDYVSETRRATKTGQKVSKFIFSLSFFLVFGPAFHFFTSFIRRRTRLLSSFFNERNHDIYKKHPEYYEDMRGFEKRIGINQLKKLHYLFERRKDVGNIYYRLLSEKFEWVKDFWKPDTPYSHIPFLHPRRDGLEKYLLKKGIETEKYFDYSIPQLKQYNATGEYPNAERLAREMINLPIYAGLDKKHITKIIDEINKFNLKNE